MAEHEYLTVGQLIGPTALADSNETLTLDSFVLIRGKADQELAKRIAALPAGEDLRSEWFWLRTRDGDLMLACFPHGDTYFETEADDGRP